MKEIHYSFTAIPINQPLWWKNGDIVSHKALKLHVYLLVFTRLSNLIWNEQQT